MILKIRQIREIWRVRGERIWRQGGQEDVINKVKVRDAEDLSKDSGGENERRKRPRLIFQR